VRVAPEAGNSLLFKVPLGNSAPNRLDGGRSACKKEPMPVVEDIEFLAGVFLRAKFLSHDRSRIAEPARAASHRP